MKNNEQDNPDHVYERYKVGEFEIEVKGPPEYVSKRIQEFMRQVRKLDSLVEEEVPNNLLPIIHEIEYVDAEEVQDTTVDLVDFFQQKSPSNQTEQVLVITYFYQQYKHREVLSVDDYEEAFQKLRKIAVKTPSNYNSTVSNVVNRTEYLYTPERGKFELTRQGEKYVENMSKE